MLKKYKYFAVISVFLLQGCNIINPPEPVPTYIHIDSFQFNPNSQYNNVSFSHNITSVWVYYNNHPVGVFDLPVTFPVIANGTGTLTVAPGINVDGLNSQMISYPFYTMDTFNFSAQPGKIIQYLPKSTYYNNLKFNVISSQYNLGFTKCDGNTSMVIVKADSLEFSPPLYNAGIFLNSPTDSSTDSCNTAFVIPAGSAFIEFNYKGDVPFYVGLQAILTGVAESTPYYLTGIYPSDTWKKFYLNVGDFNSKYQGNSYIFYVKTAVPPGQNSGKLLLSNFQLVSF